MDPVQRKMHNLVTTVASSGNSQNRLALGNALHSMLTATNPDSTHRLAPGSTPDLAQLELASRAHELHLDDPEAFGTFVAEARFHHPDDQFLTAVSTVTQSHLDGILMQIRIGATRTSRSTIDGLMTLANACAPLGGAASVTGEALRSTVGHILAGSARAYVAALDSGLLREPGAPDADVLSRPHRVSTLQETHVAWTKAFHAINECPDTAFGQKFRAALLHRAQAHLACARNDLVALRAQHERLDPNFEAAYEAVARRLSALQAVAPIEAAPNAQSV